MDPPPPPPPPAFVAGSAAPADPSAPPSDCCVEQAVATQGGKQLWLRRSRLGAAAYWFPLAAGGYVKIRQDTEIHQTVAGYAGGTVWDSSVVLCKYLEKNAARLGFGTAKRVLELGAGCGLVGLFVSQLLSPAAELVLTDLPGVVPLLAHNVQDPDALPGDARKDGCKITVETYCWGDQPTAIGADFDLVIGADVTYHRMSTPLLIESLRAVCPPGCRVIIAHEHRSDVEKEIFFKPIEEWFDVARVPDQDLDPVFRSEDIRLFELVRKQG